MGDEGGFAPSIQSNDEGLGLVTDAIEKAGYTGKVKIGMDIAASEFITEVGCGLHARLRLLGRGLRPPARLLNEVMSARGGVRCDSPPRLARSGVICAKDACMKGACNPAEPPPLPTAICACTQDKMYDLNFKQQPNDGSFKRSA